MTRARTIAVLGGVLGAAPLAVAVARADDPPQLFGRAPVIEEGAGGGEPAERALDASGCPRGMVLVEGEYCPRVEQRCLRWMDPPGRYHEYRCAEYAKPAHCLAPREHRRFCIDRRERADADTGLPLNVQSWTDAARACESQGARVCLESEWTFACEGEEMRPYPYGWRRQAAKCNADQRDLLVPGQPWLLRDGRAPAGAHPGCASPFGLLDMAGNVAEWVSVDGFADGALVVQKGNWWQPGKHACRDAQGGHDKYYRGTETGFRCCASAR
jgi:formylglycine-generating enzyme required for sulfatase activity